MGGHCRVNVCESETENVGLTSKNEYSKSSSYRVLNPLAISNTWPSMSSSSLCEIDSKYGPARKLDTSSEAIRCTHFIVPKANLHTEAQISVIHAA